MSDKLQPIEKRCVLLLGKSGAGKSTIANQLAHDPQLSKRPPFAVSDNLLASVTHEVSHKIVSFIHEGVKYVVTVIDTVGLFDTAIKGSQDPIFDKIEKYLDDYIHHINIILFVFRQGRMTAEEHEVFTFIQDRLVEEISPISALAVTGCENFKTERRDAIVKEFKVNKDTKRIAAQMEMGIYPVGFPDLDSMDPAFQKAYQPQIEKDVAALKNLIYRADKNHLTKDLFVRKIKPIMQQAAREAQLSRETQVGAKHKSLCTIL